MGDDWEGKFDEFKDIDVIYLSRIILQELIEKIKYNLYKDFAI